MVENLFAVLFALRKACLSLPVLFGILMQSYIDPVHSYPDIELLLLQIEDLLLFPGLLPYGGYLQVRFLHGLLLHGLMCHSS